MHAFVILLDYRAMVKKAKEIFYLAKNTLKYFTRQTKYLRKANKKDHLKIFEVRQTYIRSYNKIERKSDYIIL